MLGFPDLFAYTEWADSALLDAAAAQSADAWARDMGGAFPTLQSVLAHVAAGEWVWLRRWAGASPAAFPGWAAGPSPAALRDAFAEIAAERRALLAGLTEAEFASPLAYTTFAGGAMAEPLGVQMHHVVAHSAYHRGQAAAMLRRLGAAPPPTDLIAWARLGKLPV